jgi:hypothetical protein
VVGDQLSVLTILPTPTVIIVRTNLVPHMLSCFKTLVLAVSFLGACWLLTMLLRMNIGLILYTSTFTETEHLSSLWNGCLHVIWWLSTPSLLKLYSLAFYDTSLYTTQQKWIIFSISHSLNSGDFWGLTSHNHISSMWVLNQWRGGQKRHMKSNIPVL